MAWENFLLNVGNVLPQCIINNPDSWYGHFTDQNYWNDTYIDFNGIPITDVPTEMVLVSNEINQIKTTTKPLGNDSCGVTVLHNNAERWTQQASRESKNSTKVGFFCLVNYNLQEASFGLVIENTWTPTGEITLTYPAGNYPSGYSTGSWPTGDAEVYTLITSNPYITNNWQSVPSITGKNGITLNMSTLNDINDGDEVTTSDTSKFNLNKSSNIKNLVDAVI